MLIQAGLMLLDGVITFFAGVLMLRFLMQAWRVSFANPIGNFTMQATNWLVKPLRRVLPGLFGFDLASLLPVLLLKALLLLATLAANGGIALFSPEQLAFSLLMGTLFATTKLAINLLIGAIIGQAILSWVNPYHPIAGPIRQFTDPLLRPLRQLIPPIGGVDLSPLVAILLLQVVLIFL
jgi:YggT family protein